MPQEEAIEPQYFIMAKQSGQRPALKLAFSGCGEFLD